MEGENRTSEIEAFLTSKGFTLTGVWHLRPSLVYTVDWSTVEGILYTR